MTHAALLLRSRRARWSALGLVAVIAAVALALMPVTTRQGVDFQVSTISQPLWVKALGFVDRDANYRALARKITAGRTTDEARALAVFDWTRASIRDTPAGFPVVDDHIWHIIVRGYGVDDQKADVFTTLATYGGVPAYWMYLGSDGERLPISLALIRRRWRVFDVANGLALRNSRGELASAEEVAADPALVRAAARARAYRGRPYTSYFRGFQAPAPPDVLRAEEQMPWPRLTAAARRLVGLGGRRWEPDAGIPTPQRQDANQ